MLYKLVYKWIKTVIEKSQTNEDFQGYYYTQEKPNDTPLSRDFNIDHMIKRDPFFLGWKNVWRSCYSNYNVPRDDSFKGTSYENYSNNIPLLYDGVKKVTSNCL